MTNFRKLFLSVFLSAALQSWSQAEYVNPFIGASTDVGKASAYHGLGKTFPGTTTPYGMVQVSPQTITGGDNGPGYSDEHQTIEGFSMTQMSGVGWYGDLGNFMVMPTTGPLKTVAGRENGSLKGWRSRYEKATETAHAGSYYVRLSDYGIDVDCSATAHCGILRFTFPDNPLSRIQVDLARRVGGTSTRQSITMVDDRTIEGWMECTPDGGGWGNGDGKARYTVFFHATLSQPMKEYGFWSAEIPKGTNRHREGVTSDEYLQRVAQSKIIRGEKHIEGDHIGFFTEFPTHRGDQVEMKVGLSFVDIEGARKNYKAEIEGIGFEQVKAQAFEQWNKALGKVSVKGGTDDERTVFYTALYHTMIDPRIYQDVDGRYVGGDYQIHQTEEGFSKRTIFSGWDVFRSQFPLQTIINPRLVSDMINSLTSMAEQSGKEYYERWEFLNSYTGCMLGNPALSVIADAYAKGIRTFNTEKALRYAVNSSNKFSNGEKGYMPSGACISNTLEYAYFDWCLSRFASMLGEKKIAKLYQQKGQDYRNIFNRQIGWFCPRNEDGTWIDWPEDGLHKEGLGCMECNPLQQGWFVPHDVPGFLQLLGGKQKAIAMLDTMFQNTPSHMFWNQYYNHANEPVHNVPYLYNRLGYPWKTQYWTRFICQHAYDNAVAGLKGNEDVGQMSAWYVLSASGIHPYCPGETRMEITSPIFDRVEFLLDSQYAHDGKFVIIAHDNSPENVYIQSAKLNGKPYNHCYIDFSQIASGSTLELFMGPEPNKKWGSK